MHTRQEILECFVKWLSYYAYQVERYNITEETTLTRGKFKSRLDSPAQVRNGGQMIVFRMTNTLSELSAQVERELLGQEEIPYDRSGKQAHVRFFMVFQTVGQWIDWIEGIDQALHTGSME